MPDKMDSVPVCHHDKVFKASMTQVLGGAPYSEKPWICSLCGAEGSQTFADFGTSGTDYEALKSKKEAGGFHGPR